MCLTLFLPYGPVSGLNFLIWEMGPGLQLRLTWMFSDIHKMNNTKILSHINVSM